MARRKRVVAGCTMDMTPMIDIVFQLIIFFIVIQSFTKQFNESIQLADGKYGETISSELRDPFEIEVDQKGNVSIRGAYHSLGEVEYTLANRVARMGAGFPVLIRGDVRATHADIKRVMDLCTKNGIWKLSFVVVEKRAKN